MTEQALVLVALSALALYLWRLASKVARPGSEFPMKSLLVTILGAIVGLTGAGEPLQTLALVAVPLYALGPLLALWLARRGLHRAALPVVRLLYWTDEGREGLQRLLVQAALQSGDAEAALALVPAGDDLLLAQTLVEAGEWRRVLELELERSGEPGLLAASLRVEALLGLGMLDDAEHELERLRRDWAQGPQGPLGFRSLRLAEAAVNAQRGDLEEVRQSLSQPLPGVAAHRLLALLARGAQRAGRREEAVRLLQEAYSRSPARFRRRYVARIRALDGTVTTPARSGTNGRATLALAALLVLAFAGQLWLDASAGPFAASGRGSFKASTLAAAFLLGLPGLPEWDAWWRYLSYSLVHANIIHVGFNVWVLVDIGRIYEERRGWTPLLPAFAVGTAAGALLTAMLHDGGSLVLLGASGGVLGVAGALLADAQLGGREGDRFLARSLLRWMGLIVVLSLAIPNVSLWGHVGGALGGMLWTLLLRRAAGSPALSGLLAATAAALLLVATVNGLALAIRLVAL